MKRYSLQGDLRVMRRLAKPLLERARLMKTYEHHRQYFDMLRTCNSAITQLDQKRYCRSAHGNELSIGQLNMQIKYLQHKLDFLKSCGFFHGYGPREIEKDHKRLAQIKSKSVMELLPHEIAERQLLSDRLNALYLHDPETKARQRKDRLSDRAKSARHPLSVSEKQELERLERLYPGESPNYTTTCDSKVVVFHVSSGAYRNRFPNDFAKRLNIDTSASILLMVPPYGGGLYDDLREIGYDDIDCTGDVEDAFNRALYFRFDLYSSHWTTCSQSIKSPMAPY
jgi:hypothetical protein